MSAEDSILENVGAQLRQLRLAQGSTELMLKCYDLDEEGFEEVLGASDVNASDKDSRTALHEIARNGYKDEDKAVRMATKLLQAGASLDVQDKQDRFTPLMEAAIYGGPKLVTLFIEGGADVNLRAKGRKTALGLINAAPSLRARSKRVVRLLEEAGSKA